MRIYTKRAIGTRVIHSDYRLHVVIIAILDVCEKIKLQQL